MAQEIVKLFISLVSEFFFLSDIVVMASPGGPSTTAGSPPSLPTHSNSFTTAFYLTKMLTDVQESVNEVNGLDIGGDVSAGLRSLMESMRWRFEDILTHAWVRGASATD